MQTALGILELALWAVRQQYPQTATHVAVAERKLENAIKYIKQEENNG